MMRINILAAVALMLVPLTGCNARAEGKHLAAKSIPLTIMSANGSHRFNVEVARTEAEQARGLMFRTHIAPNGGMIFPMNPPRLASFWMKNCPVPEDMIFIRADGTIATIAAETTPYSLTPVNSGEPVAAVLEIAGGRAAELGIAEDDKVVWPH